MKWSFFHQFGYVLPVCMLLGAASAKAEFQAPDELGRTMFIGDSITHGSLDANLSWRWWMHRLLVDNNIPYEEIGVVRGSHRMRMLHTELNVDVVYGDSVFHNWHAAFSGARTTDVVGKRASGKFRNTTLPQWLGRTACTSAEVTPVDGSKIDTYFVLLGTNDAITAGEPYYRSEWDAEKIDSIALEIKENLKIILKEIRAGNPAARVVFIEIPTWYRWDDAAYVANHVPGVMEINKQLREWALAQGERVTMVSVNAGIIDWASAIKDRGLKCMYAEKNANGLHPNDQGTLLIAGNVAKALGYAGATAGQARRNAKDFEQGMQAVLGHAEPVVIRPGSSISGAWANSPTGGFTLDFSLRGGIGNGSTNGWDTRKAFSVSVGNGRESGILRINEAYIQWNDTVLYSLDASAGIPGPLRISYVQGEPNRGLKSGFYVWLNDQLIGEGLPSTGTVQGVTLSNETEAEVILSNLSADSTGSYAPPSNGIHRK